MDNLRAIDRLTDELKWAKRGLELVESGMRSVELAKAQAEAPEVSRIFEITCDDGRKFRQSAVDAATLQKSLSRGYTVTGQIFASGYAVPLDGPSLFDGLIQAHGPERSCQRPSNTIRAGFNRETPLI